MVYSLSYRRPAYVSSTTSRSQTSSISTNTTFSAGIPDALSFNRIISGGTCPPCTLRDFMNYLLYIEFSAENLQFYLWLRDYIQRFDALPESQKARSRPSNVEKHIPGVTSLKPDHSVIIRTTPISPSPGSSPFSNSNKAINPFDQLTSSEKESFSSNISTISTESKDHNALADAAYESVNVTCRPFTIQPYREEITRIIAIYIAEGSSRQLNLSSKEKSELLKNLAITTHPSAFVPVLRTIEWTLKHQAHPNFIRWTICNGNPPRWIFARFLGTSLITIGLVSMSILTASKVTRVWRILPGLLIFLGISTLFAGLQGMCVVLHGKHHRNLRPWELFLNDNEAALEFETKRGSWDSFGTKLSYEDEPWVVKYQNRNLIRKIFEREVWVREPALRQIQDTIFVQSLLIAIVLTVVTIGVFCAIQPGNRF